MRSLQQNHQIRLGEYQVRRILEHMWCGVEDIAASMRGTAARPSLVRALALVIRARSFSNVHIFTGKITRSLFSGSCPCSNLPRTLPFIVLWSGSTNKNDILKVWIAPRTRVNSGWLEGDEIQSSAPFLRPSAVLFRGSQLVGQNFCKQACYGAVTCGWPPVQRVSMQGYS